MDKESRRELFGKLVEIMQKLRSPEGCPWDIEQTPDSIKKHLIEEAYEVVEAINRGDREHLKEELGDLLLQVVFHSQMASEKGDFDIDDVLDSLISKLVRRHPHVFGEKKVADSKEVLFNWENIKKQEDDSDIFSGVPVSLPALLYADTIQSKASRVGFDWEKQEDVFEKIEEEIAEIKEAQSEGKDIKYEVGDLLFSVVNYCRHLGIEAEETLREASMKFIDRFRAVELEVEKRGKDFKDFKPEELDELWEKVKKERGHQWE